MSWETFHSRGSVLGDVIAFADQDRSGRLPMALPGVAENFHDELDLLSALMLKWHARLSGHVERELVDDPLDLPLAVTIAWRRAADELPGVRSVIDHYTAHPTGDFMADCLDRAKQLEWRRMAAAAGMFNQESSASLAVGERIEAEARALAFVPQLPAAEPKQLAVDETKAGLVDRFRSPRAS